eukprot:UN05356
MILLGHYVLQQLHKNNIDPESGHEHKTTKLQKLCVAAGGLIVIFEVTGFG